MRVRTIALSLLLASGVCSVLLSAEPPQQKLAAATEDGISVYFSPDGGAIEALAEQIAGAKKTLDVQAYILTTTKILGPIKAAKERGVKVRVIMDSDNAGAQYSGATYLNNAGIPTYIDADHKEAHNKVMLIDGKTIVTGSFNFTRAADEDNAENLLIIHDKPKLFAAYKANFEAHLKHSEKYEK